MMTTPDPRLAALRAQCETCTGPLLISAADALSLLDALGSAEGRLSAAEGELAHMRTSPAYGDKMARAERDALAARLAGAERVVEAARMSSGTCYVGFKENAAEIRDRLRDAVDAYDREAGGEGRGTSA
jgi:hypothetical protein